MVTVSVAALPTVVEPLLHEKVNGAKPVELLASNRMLVTEHVSSPLVGVMWAITAVASCVMVIVSVSVQPLAAVTVTM